MPLDEADKKFIGEAIGEALKAREGELAKQFLSPADAAKLVDQALKKGLGELDLAGAVKAAMGTDDQKQADGKGKKGEVDPDTKARLDDFQRKLEEAEQARKVAEQTAREQRLEGRLRSALAEAGVGTEQQEKALVWLRSRTTKDGKPVLSFNADGNPVWRTDRQGFVDELDVAEGLKGWAATDDGKSFLPPTGAAGTGDSAGGRGGSGRRDPNPRKKDGSLDVDELRKRVFSGLGSTEFAT